MGFAKLFSSVNFNFLLRVNSNKNLLRCSSSVVECGSPKKPEGEVEKSDAGDGVDSHGAGTKSSLVLGVYETKDKFELTAAAEEINQKSGGKICQYLNEMSCQLKLGKAFVVTDVVSEFRSIAISSFGRKDAGYNTLETLDETRENVRIGVGAGVAALRARGAGRVLVDGGRAVDAAAEAAHLAAWTFEEFKSCGDRTPPVELGLHSGDAAAWERGSILARAQNWARYLTDMPANKMTPVDFAQAALDVLCPLGVKVTAHERSWIEAQRMRAFLAVAAGACAPPVLLQAEYRAGGARPPVLLAAKGVTFDSGGLCLRSREDMADARGSMGGAAVAVAALRALAELKVPINVCCVIPLCENLVSGQCMKPGDVVPALNGLSLQIEDTDLEGRLLLADALVFGQALCRPALVVDVATLSRGVVQAVGGAASAVFCNSEAAWGALRLAASDTGDRVWRLPLWDYYTRQIVDDPAVDLRNRGSGTGLPCLGAAFLKNFVCGDWLHMDISGVLVGGGEAPYLRARRMSGRPARTLATFLATAATADEPEKK